MNRDSHTRLTVVMYHYVRPIVGSRYPLIKGLELSAFEGQLDYLQRHHQCVTARQVIAHARGEERLPPDPVLLTFDDGYADHFRHAFPALRRRRLTAAFFPPSCTAVDRVVLDVNKIHFLLATCPDVAELVSVIESAVDASREELELASLADYRSRYYVANRFDSAAVNYVKRMLQRGLPFPLRHCIASELFARFVSRDERDFAEELYLDVKDLREMVAAGMEVGSHGDTHQWLDSLDAEGQRDDIARSLRLLDEVGLPRRDFLFCYPYGAHNDATLHVLDKLGCGAAFTTEVALADPSPFKLLRLARLDTNDLPTDAGAEPGEWTRLASCRNA